MTDPLPLRLRRAATWWPFAYRLLHEAADALDPDHNHEPEHRDHHHRARSREGAQLLATIQTAETRLSAIDAALPALRHLAGQAPAPARRRGPKATGTAALILDVLAGGKSRSAQEIAALAQVDIGALRRRLQRLVDAGDVIATGQTSARVYRIA